MIKIPELLFGLWQENLSVMAKMFSMLDEVFSTIGFILILFDLLPFLPVLLGRKKKNIYIQSNINPVLSLKHSGI